MFCVSFSFYFFRSEIFFCSSEFLWSHLMISLFNCWIILYRFSFSFRFYWSLKLFPAKYVVIVVCTSVSVGSLVAEKTLVLWFFLGVTFFSGLNSELSYLDVASSSFLIPDLSRVILFFFSSCWRGDSSLVSNFDSLMFIDFLLFLLIASSICFILLFIFSYCSILIVSRPTLICSWNLPLKLGISLGQSDFLRVGCFVLSFSQGSSVISFESWCKYASISARSDAIWSSWA